MSKGKPLIGTVKLPYSHVESLKGGPPSSPNHQVNPAIAPDL